MRAISNLLAVSLLFLEVRLAEMSSMGIGNKPCLDIRPSADQINDRSISVAQLSKSKYPFSKICKSTPISAAIPVSLLVEIQQMLLADYDDRLAAKT